MTDQQIRALYAEGSYELVPHDSIRKIIARRLVEAKTTIPHFYLTMDCRIDKLLALRADINAAAPVKKTEAGEAPLYKLSVNDLVIKAMAMALMAVPDANVTWTEGGMLKHKARRCRRRGLDPGRADHAGRAERRHEDAVADFERDEGSRGARAEAKAEA